MRFGIYGGSFDPVHRGHLAAASAVREARGLERVFLVPAARPPHKAGGCAASFEHRLAMVRLAIEGSAGLEALDLEGRRAGRSYTVDTVEELSRGTLTQTSVYPREVVKRALHHNAAALIFAHNHPSGIAEPSRSDETLTATLRQALALVDVKVLDHFIVGAGTAMSFAERGLL